MDIETYNEGLSLPSAEILHYIIDKSTERLYSDARFIDYPGIEELLSSTPVSEIGIDLTVNGLSLDGDSDRLLYEIICHESGYPYQGRDHFWTSGVGRVALDLSFM